MTRYLLSVWHSPKNPIPDDPEAMQRMFEQTDAFNAEVQAAGSWVFAGGLRPSHATTVVRPGQGTTTMTDGPFAETKEQLGGFWVIQCDDLDQALSWAEKCALACGAPIEVRPFEDSQGE